MIVLFIAPLAHNFAISASRPSKDIKGSGLNTIGYIRNVADLFSESLVDYLKEPFLF